MKREHTFRSIAYDLNRDPRTVRQWYAKACEENSVTEIGDLIDNVRHFNDAERELLVKYLSDRPSTKKQIELTYQPSEIVSAEIVQLPDGGFFDPALALARFDNSKGEVFEDPMAIVDAISETLDRVEMVLGQKIDQQLENLEKTKKATQALQERKSRFELRREIAANEARKLAAQQSAATANLKEVYQEVMESGKSDE